MITLVHQIELIVNSFLLLFEHPEKNLIFLFDFINLKAIAFTNLAEFIHLFFVLNCLSLKVF